MQHTLPATKSQIERAAADIANARRMIAALEHFIEARKPRYTRSAEWALFEVCNAGIALVDDGDFLAQRESLMFELGCDCDGYPDDAPAEFNPSMVHPDDPCQGKGWA
jgi:hypothetical protein